MIERRDELTIEEKIKMIIDIVNCSSDKRMNKMMAPTFVDYDEKTDTANISYKFQEWEKNVRGEMHGGAIASMFDLAMSLTAVAYNKGCQVSTVDLSISYVRPFTGEEFIFSSEVIHSGRKLTRVRGVARCKSTGKVSATSTATFINLENLYV